MGWITGTINNPVNVANDLMAALSAELTAHPAWTFIEEVDASPSIAEVWRSAGASNSWGQDFYLSLFRNVDSHIVGARPSEDYDPATKDQIRTTPIYTTDYAIDNAGGFWTGVHDATYVHVYYGLDLANVSTAYLASVTADRVIFAATSYNSYCYAGLFDAAVPGFANEFPLVSITGNTGAGTRVPAYPARVAEYSQANDVFKLNAMEWGYSQGTVGVDTTKDYLAGGFVASRIRLASQYGQDGACRGWLKSMAWLPISATYVSAGDTITIDGIEYCYLGGTNYWVRTDET